MMDEILNTAAKTFQFITKDGLPSKILPSNNLLSLLFPNLNTHNFKFERLIKTLNGI